jgi:NADPH-dependent 2,4-dienoyl-CoA reductase/sulfur reductase-like enzyme
VSRVPLIVLGAGPAGVAAARAATDAHVPVVLVDLAERPGGQYHRREPLSFSATDPGALQRDWPDWAQELERLRTSPRLTHLGGTTVWAASRREDGTIVLATDHPELHELEADAVIIATGAHERVVPFPGWDLPGVLTIGGAQALLKGQGMRPGHHVVVSGAGPLLLPVAASLARVGTDLVALSDAGDTMSWLRGALRHGPRALPAAKLREGLGHLATLARHGVRLRTRTAAIRAEGDGRVEQVTLARLDADWHIVGGSERTFTADALATSHGFVPDLSVALALGCRLAAGRSGTAAPTVAVDRWQATSLSNVWAAGELTGIGGAEVAAHEGRLAGLSAARTLGGRVAEDLLVRAVARRRNDEPFVRTLAEVLDLPSGWTSWMQPDTVVCRCEDVALRTIDEAILRRGACDLRSVKLTTRCGMGYCQGRVCAPSVAGLILARTGVTSADAGSLDRRPVITPVALGRL